VELPPRLDQRRGGSFFEEPARRRLLLMQRFQIHLVTDRKRARGGNLSHVVQEALLGGIDCVQVREKSGPARELYETVLELLPLARETGGNLLVNDRVDVALASGADGVHLAAKSLPPEVARELLGEKPLLGCSVHGLRAAREAVGAGADYVTFGHVYPTTSKPGLPPRGVRELAEIVESVEVPVLAIGGVDESNVHEVLATGASGIAVISTIMTARDPRLAAKRLRQALDSSPHRPRHTFSTKNIKGAR
jgi:thiamine-phosphate pyrophosphorylase